MSLNLSVYKLEIPRLRAVQGSSDRVLLLRVIDENRELIEQHDQFYRSGAARYLSLADAVGQIIEGVVDEQAEPLFQFEHAAALIAGTLGEVLDPGLLRESHPELWEDADTFLQDQLVKAGFAQSAFLSLESLLSRGPVLEIPIDPLNPLGSGYLTGEEVQQALEVFGSIDLGDDGALGTLLYDEEALDVVRSYSSWIADAARDALGLYFHA